MDLSRINTLPIHSFAYSVGRREILSCLSKIVSKVVVQSRVNIPCVHTFADCVCFSQEGILLIVTTLHKPLWPE